MRVAFLTGVCVSASAFPDDDGLLQIKSFSVLEEEQLSTTDPCGLPRDFTTIESETQGIVDKYATCLQKKCVDQSSYLFDMGGGTPMACSALKDSAGCDYEFDRTFYKVTVADVCPLSCKRCRRKARRNKKGKAKITFNTNGYKSSPMGQRCKQSAKSVFVLEALEVFNDQLVHEQEADYMKKQWKKFWSNSELHNKANEILQGKYNVTLGEEIPYDDGTVDESDDVWKGYRAQKIQIYREGLDESKFFTFNKDTVSSAQSKTVCVVGAIDREVCKRLCDVVTECEAFGTHSETNGDTYSRCCMNNLFEDDIDPDSYQTWTQPSNQKTWQCHLKMPSPPPPTTATTTTFDCFEKLKEDPYYEGCATPGGCNLWTDDDKLDVNSPTFDQALVDKHNFSKKDYWGNCRSYEGSGDTKNWQILAFASGMSSHLVGTSIAAALEGKHSKDPDQGVLYSAKAAWKTAAAGKPSWTVEELKSKTWSTAEFEKLTTAQKPGCVRKISYENCRAEAARLVAEGVVDAFDYLWGEYEKTDEYKEYLKTKPADAENTFPKEKRLKYEIDPVTGEKTRKPKVTGVSKSDFFGETIHEYAPLDDEWTSACCLFKTPEGQKMGGAYLMKNIKGEQNLWQRKCTVCLEPQPRER